MGRFINSLGRRIRAFLSIISLGLIKGAKRVEENPEIMAMEFDDIIKAKKTSAKRVKDAVGGLMAQQEKAFARVKRIENEIDELAEVRDGAMALAQERMKVLQGQGVAGDAVLSDGEVMQYQSAYNDAATTINEKESRIEDLTEQAKSLQTSIDQYTIQAQELAREVEKIRSEKYETVASVTASRELDEVNEIIAGISTSGTADRLAQLREIRAEKEGRAKASARIAGTDTRLQTAKLKAAARTHVQNKEFLKGLGLDKKAPATPVAQEETEEVPKTQARPEQGELNA